MPRIRLALVPAAVVLALVSAPASSTLAATRTTFNVRATFQGSVAPGFLTDGYEVANGYPSGFGIYNNAAMSAFFNQSDYFTTGFSNLNIIQGPGNQNYCAGCNGSYRLDFNTTSLTVGGVGVFGVGVDILTNSSSLPYHAFVTYGDNTTEDFPLAVGASFFGITSPDLIKSIHMGLAGGGATTSGSFVIDNLTIGSSGGAQPTATPPRVEGAPDMQIAKTDAPDPVIAGNNLVYNIQVSNIGQGTATAATMSDPLPANTRFVSLTNPGFGFTCSTPAVGGTGTVSCTGGTMAPNASGTFVLTVRICPDTAASTIISNTATTSATGEVVLTNNASTATTTVQRQSDLSITKTDAPDPVVAGQPLVYTLNVSNLGPSNVAGVTVVDTLPALVTFNSATTTISGMTCSAAGQVVTCSNGSLGAANQCATALATTGTVTINTTVSPLAPCSPAICPGSPGAPLSNTATVSYATGTNILADPVAGNNTATQSTNVRAGADVAVEDPIVVNANAGQCITGGAILLVTQTFGNTGPRAFTPQRDNPGPEFESALPAQVVGQAGTCVVVQGGGACTIDPGQVTWNGAIAVGDTVILQYRVRVRGGVAFGTEICITGLAHYDNFNTGSNTAQRTASACVLVDCPPTVNPNAALSGQVHLPIMNFQGQNDVCRTWIEVQNVGNEFSKAALVTWGEPGFCPPQCSGPLKVECSGLLKPGSTWNFLGAQIPSGSKSGILFAFTARQLSQIGVDLGFDDIVADYLCETLFFNVVGDCDDYRRFKKAYNEGLEFAGVPLDRAVGGPLAVEVLRHCPGDQTPGAEVSSKYGGIAGIDLGAYDPVFGGYAYYVPLLYAESADYNSVMYIQNGGLECSSVEIWFKAQDDCLRVRICEVFTLAPGESWQFDSNDCVGPDFQGNAWVRSSQPLGIAVDIFGRDVLMTYVGIPTELNYTFDPNEALFTTGNQVAYGPLIYSEYEGWDSGVQVQNMSSVTAAKVKVYFLDRSGDVITTLIDWICPRGSQTYFLPVVADLPGHWVGSLRVESQEWFSPGDPLVAAPNISGIVTLIKYTDAARSDTSEAIAYNLLVEARAYDWQVGCCAGGTESGIGLIAIPSILKDQQNTGVTAELAIANLVPKPGFTDLAIYVYDQNGLLDYVCEKLNEKQVEYIDFDTWGYVNPGFKGSAIISATFWEHDMFDDTGFFIRNLLGLAAVVVERTGTRMGEDIPGDEAAGTTGIPFREVDTEDEQFFFDFEGPVAPRCPGQPGTRPDPLACPDAATIECQDCPLAIADLASQSSTMGIGPQQIPAACQVTDVNMLLDLSHTWIGDLQLDLTSPDLDNVPLFSNICNTGPFPSIKAILDDEAAQPIGGVCPPAGFASFDTAPPDNLTQFEGAGTNGTWRLDITDNQGQDSGTLNNWALEFTFGP